MSLFESTADSCQEVKPQQIEKMLLKMAILHLILCITVKRGGISDYMKSSGDRLGRWERARQGNLWDWINKTIDILLLHR